MDSNESYLKKLKSKRNDILLGEIAALLHDIGKCHPDFIKSHSIDSNELKHNNTPLNIMQEISIILLWKFLKIGRKYQERN